MATGLPHYCLTRCRINRSIYDRHKSTFVVSPSQVLRRLPSLPVLRRALLLHHIISLLSDGSLDFKVADSEHANEPISVTPLRYSDASNAARTFVDAFADDPVLRYVRETPDYEPHPGEKRFEKAFLTLLMSLWIRRKLSLTVKNGVAFVIATPAKDHASGPTERFYDWLAAHLLRIIGKLGSAEGRKRIEEVQTKTTEVVSRTIGDRAKDMVHIDSLATEPVSQHRGYGGALLNAVTGLADLMSQAVWLESTNIANTDFYISHGFVTVGETVVGDKNPTWTKAPVVIRIMVREPRSLIMTDEKLM